jgi:guanine nucleotide-binding protein G(i) subunit alpha
MKESLALFDETINSKWFTDTSIILFLNKDDLFREKIKRSNLNVLFDDYDGGLDYEKASNFIRIKFEEKNKYKDTKKIYTNITCATDTDSLKKVFDNITDIITRKVK